MGFEWLPAKNYKKHYICLDCQKGFKRASDEDRKHQKMAADVYSLMEAYYAAAMPLDIVSYIQAVHIQQQEVCPQCQKAMIQVSYVFEVPKQRNQKTWKELRKRLAAQPSIDYKPYLHWHIYQLQQTNIEEAILVRLQNNVVLLEQL